MLVNEFFIYENGFSSVAFENAICSRTPSTLSMVVTHLLTS